MKISLYTLGCKLNQAESDELKEELIEKQYEIVDFGDNENICIVRGCGVTHGASQRTRQIIRSAKRNKVYTITTGCVENKDLEEIDFLADNNEKIIRHIEKNFPIKNKNKTEKDKNYVRKFIKIQNGCNFNCAYCIIPSFRGKNTSIPAEKIINKIKKLEKENYQEIVLTGVNICQYKYKNLNLAKLLKKILSETKIKRIRLGSLDPRLMTDELIEVFKNEKMMPHTHLSLQSGSDKILKKMNRNYNTKKYLEITKKFKKINKDFSFTTDIIVGFPGETEKDFDKSCNFVEKIGFSKIHVFPYSKRPGTKAEKMNSHVDEKIKKQRVKKLIEIGNKVSKKYLKKLKGQTKLILIEGERNGFYEGYTPEFTRIKINSKKNIKNEIIKIKI